jgi:hypothetical protein
MSTPKRAGRICSLSVGVSLCLIDFLPESTASAASQPALRFQGLDRPAGKCGLQWTVGQRFQTNSKKLLGIDREIRRGVKTEL